MYKQRIRIQDFFADFDKLRCGGVTAAQFASALSMAGFNLAAAEYAELASAYPCDVPDKPVAWKAFCADVNLVFSKANLEKNPLEEVALEPENILDPTRFSVRPNNDGSLGGGGDEALDALLERTATRLGAAHAQQVHHLQGREGQEVREGRGHRWRSGRPSAEVRR